MAAVSESASTVLEIAPRRRWSFPSVPVRAAHPPFLFVLFPVYSFIVVVVLRAGKRYSCLDSPPVASSRPLSTQVRHDHRWPREESPPCQIYACSRESTPSKEESNMALIHMIYMHISFLQSLDSTPPFPFPFPFPFPIYFAP